MIDTDKYEGHTEGKWKLHYDDSAIDGDYLDYGAQLDPVGALHPMSVANAQLIADAPLLLAEFKRMNRFAHCAMNFMSKHDLHFQFLNEHGVFTAPDGGSISMFIPYSYKWDDETKVSSESIQLNVRGEEE